MGGGMVHVAVCTLQRIFWCCPQNLRRIEVDISGHYFSKLFSTHITAIIDLEWWHHSLTVACFRFISLSPHSQLLVSGFARLKSVNVMLKLVFLQSLHGIKVLWDWNIISVDGSWTLWHVLKNVVDGTDSCYERDSWTLDTALRGLPLVYKVGLSLTVDNALESGKYFRLTDYTLSFLEFN